MKKYRFHLIALGIVTAWAASSYAYLGVEDGSSGLSPLGWLHAVFFLPGLLLTGRHSNADLPRMAVISWAIYSIAAVGIAQAVCIIKGLVRSGAQPTRSPDL